MGTGPNFARFRKALLNEGEPDRVPLWEGSVHCDVKDAFMGRPVYNLESDVEFWATAGYDYVPLEAGFLQVLRPEFNLARKEDVKDILAGKSLHKVIEERYDPFCAKHRGERSWAVGGKGLITTLDEFNSFPWPEAQDFDYSLFEEVSKYLPPRMKVVANSGYIYTSIWMVMGFEVFCVSIIDNPDLVARMFEKVGSIQYKVLETLIGFDCVGGVRMLDDIAYTTGLMIAPKYLRQYLFPWYERMGHLCKEQGLIYFYHSDGKLYQVMHDILEIGFDGLHPIEPKAMDIVRLKREVGDRLCLLGNIDLDYTLSQGSVEEVVEETKARLREVAPGGGYCLGSSNSVTEYVPLENFGAMRETVLEYGVYPISI
jgi:uroporphyrinogen decarboxylase